MEEEEEEEEEKKRRDFSQPHEGNHSEVAKAVSRDNSCTLP